MLATMIEGKRGKGRKKKSARHYWPKNTPQVKTDQQAIVALPDDINSKITIPPPLTGVVYVW